MVPRIITTQQATDLIARLRDLHGPLMFHQSGGCCDGSQPMCLMRVATIEGCKFYMATDQFEYWKHTQLILDVTPGRGTSFSLEIPLGLRFFVRSRLFTEEELPFLEPLGVIET